MSFFKVYGICCADDVWFLDECEAVAYAEELGEKCEAIYEVTDDGEEIQRDDLLSSTKQPPLPSIYKTKGNETY